MLRQGVHADSKDRERAEKSIMPSARKRPERRRRWIKSIALLSKLT